MTHAMRTIPDSFSDLHTDCPTLGDTYVGTVREARVPVSRGRYASVVQGDELRPVQVRHTLKR